jgi:phage tail-like protein
MQPKHSFLVRFGGGPECAFQEMSALKSSTAGHRATNGRHKSGHVTLKRGVIASSAEFWHWMKHSKTQPVVIKLLDERGRVDLTWKLTNARPKRMTAPGPNTQRDAVVIEEIVVTYERVEIEP